MTDDTATIVTTTLPEGWTVEHDVALDTLVEHPDNPRKGSEAQIEASIKRHGFVDSLVAQTGTRRLLSGNHRARVARKRCGYTTAPVVIWADVDDDEARRLLLAYNRASDDAEYDRTALHALLAELQSTDDGLVGTLYGDEDVDELYRLTGELGRDASDFLADLEPDEDPPDPGDETPSGRGIDRVFHLTFPFDQDERTEMLGFLREAKEAFNVESSANACLLMARAWSAQRHAGAVFAEPEPAEVDA